MASEHSMARNARVRRLDRTIEVSEDQVHSLTTSMINRNFESAMLR